MIRHVAVYDPAGIPNRIRCIQFLTRKPPHIGQAVCVENSVTHETKAGFEVVSIDWEHKTYDIERPESGPLKGM